MMSSGRLPFSHLKPTFSRHSTTAATATATKLRKKVFCVNGRSPARRMNAAIIAKPNADIMIKPIALLFLESTDVFLLFVVNFLTASIVTHKLFRVAEKSSVFRVLKFFKKI